MTRREARIAAFQLIYERSVQKNKPISEIIKDTSQNQDFIPNKYIKTVLKGTEEKLPEIDSLINENSIKWRIERMSTVSLSILRLAVYEMLYLDEVPFKVAINEAVELAKIYDHDKAPSFINGILNKIAVLKGLKTETPEQIFYSTENTEIKTGSEKKYELKIESSDNIGFEKNNDANEKSTT